MFRHRASNRYAIGRQRSIISTMYKLTIRHKVQFKCEYPITMPTDSRLEWLLFQVQAYITLGQGYKAAKATKILVRKARQLNK